MECELFARSQSLPITMYKFNTMANTLLTLSTTNIIFFLLFSPSCACNKQDKKTLVAFKNSFPSTVFSNWDSSTDCCSWDHVGCDDPNGRVTLLDFSDEDGDTPFADLDGPIPPSIGDLPFLRAIVFRGLPSLVGAVPPELARLKNLEFLTITRTNVSGPVPSFLSQIPSLQVLNLGENMFTGAIPSSLGSLVNLTKILMNGNRLRGSIPSSLCGGLGEGLSVELDLSENTLSGPIPRSFQDVAFSSINLQGNRLTGEAYVLFGKNKPANTIFIGRNKFSFDLSKVEYPVLYFYNLDISHNKIYGNISEQMAEGGELRYLDVSYNKLCGKIPTGGSFAMFEKEVYAHNKCLCGAPLAACK